LTRKGSQVQILHRAPSSSAIALADLTPQTKPGADPIGIRWAGADLLNAPFKPAKRAVSGGKTLRGRAPCRSSGACSPAARSVEARPEGSGHRVHLRLVLAHALGKARGRRVGHRAAMMEPPVASPLTRRRFVGRQWRHGDGIGGRQWRRGHYRLSGRIGRGGNAG
jgi:hypothetical protein